MGQKIQFAGTAPFLLAGGVLSVSVGVHRALNFPASSSDNSAAKKAGGCRICLQEILALAGISPKDIPSSKSQGTEGRPKF